MEHPKFCDAISADGKINFAAMDVHLLRYSYLDGWVPGKRDTRGAEVFESLGKEVVKDLSKYPNVARWAEHVKSFASAERATWG